MNCWKGNCLKKLRFSKTWFWTVGLGCPHFRGNSFCAHKLCNTKLHSWSITLISAFHISSISSSSIYLHPSSTSKTTACKGSASFCRWKTAKPHSCSQHFISGYRTQKKKKLLWLLHLEHEQGKKPMVILGNSLSRALGIKLLCSHWISYYKWAIPPLMTVILWQVPAPIQKYADYYLFFEQNVLEWKFIPSLIYNRNMFKGKHHLFLADGKLALKRITCTGNLIL